MANQFTVKADIYDALGINKDTVLIDSGDYSNGFWHNELLVRLDELQEGNISNAFALYTDIHDTAGVSFRQYNGVDRARTMPSGVDPSSLVELCQSIWRNRKQLTNGLDFEYRGTDLRAAWKPGYGDCAIEALGESVRDLPRRQVYDLGDSENYPFVKEAVESLPDTVDATDIYSVSAYMQEQYQDDSETIFIGYQKFAEKFAEEFVSEQD